MLEIFGIYVTFNQSIINTNFLAILTYVHLYAPRYTL